MHGTEVKKQLPIRIITVIALLLGVTESVCLATAEPPPPASLPSLPKPDSPLRLLDLRRLGRAPGNEERFLVDTWTEPRSGVAMEDNTATIADLEGPGVILHLMADLGVSWIIEVDGNVVYEGTGQEEAWTSPHHTMTRHESDELPWAWPLAARTHYAMEYLLPIPFNSRLRVLADREDARLWLVGEKLDERPLRQFSDNLWTEEAKTVHDFMGVLHRDSRKTPPVESWQGIHPLPGSETLMREAHPGPDERVNLLALDGAGEVIGMRFEFKLPFNNRLRYLVVEITPDGANAPFVRMPIMDLLGNTHPFFRLWGLTHGTLVTGLQHPAWHDPWLTGWFRLPVPFANGLRIDLVNRHTGLPQHVRAQFRVAQLKPEEAERAWRLCGMATEIDLPPEVGESTELLRFPAEGRLVKITMLTTGHSGYGQWTSGTDLRLTDDEGVSFAGFPLFPLPRSPFSAKPMNPTWFQPRYERNDWFAGSRDFWIDPVRVKQDMRLEYLNGGEDGPDKADLSVLWYQAEPYTAPVVAKKPRDLPARQLEYVEAEKPGGWAVEGENLIGRALTTGGDVYVDRNLALDAQASGDAFLAWNAPGMGAALDLLVRMPPTPYVQTWIRSPKVPGGGRFELRLVPAEKTNVNPVWELENRDFTAHSRGYIVVQNLIDSYSVFPFQRLLGHQPRAYLRNPAPGEIARLRFVAANMHGGRLTIDQITVNPAPPIPDGWHDMEKAFILSSDPSVRSAWLEKGRTDFYGYGGLRITASSPGTIRFQLENIAAPVTPYELRIRGIVQKGEWTAMVEGSESVALEADGNDPQEWLIKIPTDRKGRVELSLSAGTRNAMFLLNAWKLKE